jgi:hypothetical protein
MTLNHDKITNNYRTQILMKYKITLGNTKKGRMTTFSLPDKTNKDYLRFILLMPSSNALATLLFASIAKILLQVACASL